MFKFSGQFIKRNPLCCKSTDFKKTYSLKSKEKYLMPINLDLNQKDDAKLNDDDWTPFKNVYIEKNNNNLNEINT